MNLPKKILKMSNEEQRKWVADKLKQVRYEEDQLVKILRQLVANVNFKPKVDVRPDDMK